MSTQEHLAPPAAAAAGGALIGKAVVARTGMPAAGMVGSGTGFGAAAGPVGIVFGALAGLAAYAVLRSIGDAAEERATVEAWLEAERQTALAQAVGWAADWAEETVEVTGSAEDRVKVAEATASFDRWLAGMFDDQRPAGWAIWTSRVAMLRRLGVDPSGLPTWTLIGVRLRD